MAKKKGNEPVNKKVTNEQQEEICKLFFEEGWKQKDLSAKFGVTQSRISDIVNHPDNLTRMLKRTTADKVRAQIKINNHLLEAVDKQIELMRGEYDVQYKYLNQNAARDILDRGGVRVEKDEKPDVRIALDFGDAGAFELGVPDHSGDNDENVLPESEE